MEDATKEKAAWKERLVRELREYWFNVLYLAIFFGVFTWYRRLILAEYRITYVHYSIAIIEALVLAKLIALGHALHLGRGFEHRPLIYPAVYKTIVFSLFVMLFGLLEHTIDGLLHGKGLTAGFHMILHEGRDELLARCLLTFFAFIPFFAFKELGRVLGKGKLQGLFFLRPLNGREALNARETLNGRDIV